MLTSVAAIRMSARTSSHIVMDNQRFAVGLPLSCSGSRAKSTSAWREKTRAPASATIPSGKTQHESKSLAHRRHDLVAKVCPDKKDDKDDNSKMSEDANNDGCFRQVMLLDFQLILLFI